MKYIFYVVSIAILIFFDDGFYGRMYIIFLMLILLSLKLHYKLRIYNIIKLFVTFVNNAVLGAVQVLSLAISRDLNLKPLFVYHKFEYIKGVKQILYCWLVSLMPGTLSVLLKDGGVYIHILHSDLHRKDSLIKLEILVHDTTQ